MKTARENIVSRRGYRQGYRVQQPDLEACNNSDECRVYLSAWDDGFEDRFRDDTIKKNANATAEEAEIDQMIPKPANAERGA